MTLFFTDVEVRLCLQRHKFSVHHSTPEGAHGGSHHLGHISRLRRPFAGVISSSVVTDFQKSTRRLHVQRSWWIELFGSNLYTVLYTGGWLEPTIKGCVLVTYSKVLKPCAKIISSFYVPWLFYGGHRGKNSNVVIPI